MTTEFDQRDIERAAFIAHEVNRAYCEAIGDSPQPAWVNAPGWQRSSVIDGVLSIVKNPGITPAESHQGWLDLKLKEGWSYGPVKDPEKKEHPCFVPYDQLPTVQKIKDYLFAAAVRSSLGML